MNEIAASEVAWLVGFYEGEGSCSAYLERVPSLRNLSRVALKVAFTQKDTEPLLKVRDILGFSGSLKRCRDAHQLVYSGAQARRILELMKPHLSERRQGQIDKAMGIWRDRPEKGRGRRGGSVNSPGQMRLL